MKKHLVLFSLVLLLVICCFYGCSCGNMTMFDTTYTFDKAIISLPNGKVIEVEVAEWCDYEGEQIQIKAKDGTIYLTSSFNCVLIKENE